MDLNAPSEATDTAGSYMCVMQYWAGGLCMATASLGHSQPCPCPTSLPQCSSGLGSGSASSSPTAEAAPVYISYRKCSEKHLNNYSLLMCPCFPTPAMEQRLGKVCMKDDFSDGLPGVLYFPSFPAILFIFLRQPTASKNPMSCACSIKT